MLNNKCCLYIHPLNRQFFNLNAYYCTKLLEKYQQDQKILNGAKLELLKGRRSNHCTLPLLQVFLIRLIYISNIVILVATAPTNLAASAISATSIRLTWNQPTSLNGILHDYKVRYKMASEANYGASISVDKQLTFTATILKPYTDFEFQVDTHNFIFAATFVYFIT